MGFALISIINKLLMNFVTLSFFAERYEFSLFSFELELECELIILLKKLNAFAAKWEMNTFSSSLVFAVY